jgi:hypothetical protein
MKGIDHRRLDRARHALYTVRERYETSDGARISGIWGKGLYRGEYDRLNRKYFGGKLPACNTQMGYIETGTPVDWVRTGADGHFDPERRRITLSQLGEAVARHHGKRKLKTWVRRTLFREMCRIAADPGRRAPTPASSSASPTWAKNGPTTKSPKPGARRPAAARPGISVKDRM